MRSEHGSSKVNLLLSKPWAIVSSSSLPTNMHNNAFTGQGCQIADQLLVAALAQGAVSQSHEAELVHQEEEEEEEVGVGAEVEAVLTQGETGAGLGRGPRYSLLGKRFYLFRNIRDAESRVPQCQTEEGTREIERNRSQTSVWESLDFLSTPLSGN